MFLKFSIISYYLLIYSFETKACACKKYNDYKPYSDRSKYFARLSDSKILSNLAVVGTYISFSYNSNLEKFKTQDLTIKQQLKYGVRFFDIGVRPTFNRFVVYLDEFTPTIGFKNAFTEFDRFLYHNPSEIVFVHLAQVYPPSLEVTKGNCQILKSYIGKNGTGKRFVINWKLEDTIGQYRGKILLASMDFSFYGCVFDLRSECDVSYDFVNKYEKSLTDFRKKWKNISQFMSNTYLGFEKCYVYSISMADGINSRRSIAKDGGFSYGEYCAVPMNRMMAQQFENPHRGLIIVFGDFWTQDLIDAISDTNFPNSTWRSK